MSKKILQICIVVINILGIVCLIYCAVMYLSHDTYVSNPDAMLPLTTWECGALLLTIGMIPMLIANTSGFLCIPKEKNLYIRLLFFIPSIIEICLVMHFWITSLI